MISSIANGPFARREECLRRAGVKGGDDEADGSQNKWSKFKRSAIN